jgi:hypothetical protein
MRTRLSENQQAGLSLVEMMVATGLFGLVVIGIVYVHMFGLRQNQLVNSKLGASDQSRRGFDLLTMDVRSSKAWQIGNGDILDFTPIPNGDAQEGTALMIHLTTDTNRYVMYWFDTARRELRRSVSGDSRIKVIAQSLTNTMFFRAENYRGETQYDLTHKGVVNVKMEFAEYQYPLTKVGPGQYYDYYKMEFRLTSHVPDGP